MNNSLEPIVSDLADGVLSGPEWERWLMEHPQAADELAIVQRVQALMETLHAAEVTVPAGFAARLHARVRADNTARDLLDLGLSGVGRVVLELLALFFAAIPESATAGGAAD